MVASAPPCLIPEADHLPSRPWPTLQASAKGAPGRRAEELVGISLGSAHLLHAVDALCQAPAVLAFAAPKSVRPAGPPGRPHCTELCCPLAVLAEVVARSPGLGCQHVHDSSNVCSGLDSWR